MSRGRPKGSKNKQPYPVTDAVLLRNRRSAHLGGTAAAALFKGRRADSYGAVHKHARRELPKVCELADESCKGRLEAALRKEVRGGLSIRYRNDGAPFFVGPVAEGYMRLCTSHHIRYDRRKE